jgi:hypothetical protein
MRRTLIVAHFAHEFNFTTTFERQCEVSLEGLSNPTIDAEG